MSENEQQKMDRRDLIRRGVMAGASLAAAGGLSFAALDTHGPTGDVHEDTIEIPNLALENRQDVMSIVKGANRRGTLRKALDLLGGIEKFITKGDRVLIKVNAAFATPAKLGATTHPDTLGELIKLCYDRGGAREVIVADNPINDAQSCFKLTGIGKAASEAGATVMLPKEVYFEPTTVIGAELIRNWPVFFEPFKTVNKVIGLTPIKDHHRSGASMTMKNWYGLMGGRRNIFHQDIHTIISELAMMVKPTLVILDGTVSMISNGPTGGSLLDLKETNTMIAGTDQLAVDTFGATLLGLDKTKLGYLGKAEKAGVGTTNYESLKPLRGEVGEL